MVLGAVGQARMLLKVIALVTLYYAVCTCVYFYFVIFRLCSQVCLFVPLDGVGGVGNPLLFPPLFFIY